MPILPLYYTNSYSAYPVRSLHTEEFFRGDTVYLFKKKQYKKCATDELVEMAQNDDTEALEELVKRHQSSVYASFYYLSNECQDILDLTQEALLKMARNIKSLKDPKKFKGWLNQIVTNVFYDYIRKTSRSPQTVPIEKTDDDKTDTCPKIIELPCKSKNPEENTLGDELSDVIENSIHKLPDAFRLAIVLREFQGLSYEEIAEITKTNVGTVKSRIARARSKLQEDLKSYIA